MHLASDQCCLQRFVFYVFSINLPQHIQAQIRRKSLHVKGPHGRTANVPALIDSSGLKASPTGDGARPLVDLEKVVFTARAPYRLRLSLK